MTDPSELGPRDPAPTELAPSELAPSELAPSELAPAELALVPAAVAQAIGDGLYDIPALTRSEATELRRALGATAGRATAGRATAGARPGDVVRLDRYRLGQALQCPGSAVEAGEFTWSAPKAARRLGLAALGHDHESGGGVWEAARLAVASEISLGYRLGQWLAELAPPGRAAAVTAGASWAARAHTVLGRPMFGGGLNFSEVSVRRSDLQWSPVNAGRNIQLVGRADVVVGVGRGPDRRAVVVIGRPDALSMRLDALVATLTLPKRPSRIVTVDPSSGQVERLDITMAELARSQAEVTQGVAALTPAPGGDIELRPGPYCQRCEHQSNCVRGQEWEEARPRRIGGIPF